MTALSELGSLKKDELKAKCRARSLNVSGNKKDLIERLQWEIAKEEREGSSRSNNKTAMNGHPHAGGDGGISSRMLSSEERQMLKEERESIVLWRKPWTTVNYAFRELVITAVDAVNKLLAYRLSLLALAVFAVGSIFLYVSDGPHRQAVLDTEKYLLWCLWWVGLGVLSSVGLGTGLHTFLLYLGPHIAAVTMAAYECGSTDFPAPPYPDSIICPEEPEESAAKVAISVWDILSKVRVEAFCWGAGTALGELPPYFMARAHRLSGYDPDEEEDEFDELQEKAAHPERLSMFDRAKLGVERLVEKVGFFGILACASIPNPLFDLAGITCGHFLVPFWTFFGATLIGKAIIKMHIQKFFVILAFNESLINHAVSHVADVPIVGKNLQGPFKAFLAQQKEKLHRRSEDLATATEPNILSWIFEKFVLAMVAYFLLSILNSLAQSYHKRIHKRNKTKENGIPDKNKVSSAKTD